MEPRKLSLVCLLLAFSCSCNGNNETPSPDAENNGVTDMGDGQPTDAGDGEPDVPVDDMGMPDAPDADMGTADQGMDLGPDMPPPGLPPLTLEPIANGFTSPIGMAFPDDGTGRSFVIDQVGVIRTFDADLNLDPTPFADLRDRLVTLMDGFDERGLLGLAFHPDFANNGRLYVFYSAPLRATAPADFDHTNVISEFMVDADGNFDPASERKLLEIDHPYFNHNGGTLAFGQDGYLYISLGDGGNRNDIGTGHTPGLGNAQDVSNLHGSILRIDPDSGDPYAVPADNPFVGQTGADEIYAWGLRNPYRFAFDRGTGRLFVGDAGQDLMEEVSIVERGENYGWNIKEGTLCFNPDDAVDPPDNCADVGPNGNPLIDPILTFTRPLSAFDMPSQEVRDIIDASPVVGLVVVGGVVYRGATMPAYDGRYFFGSWSDAFDMPSGKIFIGTEDNGSWSLEPAVVDGATDGAIAQYVLGFGEDPSGEVYVLTTMNTGPTGTTGQVLRLVPQ